MPKSMSEIPDNSKYLPGIGAGAFFHIEATNDME